MPVNFGELRHRIVIERPQKTRDLASGAVVVDWLPVVTVWAKLVSLSGREFLAADAKQAGVQHKCLIRYRADITPAMRVRQSTTVYNIQAVLPDPTHVEYLQLMLETGITDGQ